MRACRTPGRHDPHKGGTMRRSFYVLAVLLVAAALLAACGGGGGGAGQTGGTTGTSGAAAAATAAPAGDAKAGETLFAQATIGSNPGCKTCHSLDGSKLVGPSMQGIGTRAGTEVQGQSAQVYMHTSIVDPNAHVVEGLRAGRHAVVQDRAERSAAQRPGRVPADAEVISRQAKTNGAPAVGAPFVLLAGQHGRLERCRPSPGARSGQGCRPPAPP